MRHKVLKSFHSASLMDHKKKSLLKWKIISRILKILETLAIVVSSFVVIQIPKQINEWNLNQSNRSTDLLLRLEDRLRTGNNKKIISIIEAKNPILFENKGIFSKQDLDYYLNDLMSISDVYSKGLIDCDSVYSWFSDYIDKTLKNEEIKKYIFELRKIDKNSFLGIEEFANEIDNCN